MTSRKNIFKLRLINALVFIVLFYIQYNGIFSIKIAQANPLLCIAFLVTMCMFCSELTSTITGLVLGIFIDTVTATPPGFNALLLMVLGLAVSLIVKHLFNNNIFSAIALCTMCATIYYLLRWLLHFAFVSSVAENLTYLLQIALPSVLYTVVFAVPFYYFQKALHKKFYK
ncbi:MAG: rod shape-determining protein MreD [Clostridia bacterium]|nr:rod shape-determining protein MreD [Clostridia bacterium]